MILGLKLENNGPRSKKISNLKDCSKEVTLVMLTL